MSDFYTENEIRLKKYREMIKHPETDYKVICTNISIKGKKIRTNNLILLMIEIVNSGDEKITPKAVKLLTELIDLRYKIYCCLYGKDGKDIELNSIKNKKLLEKLNKEVDKIILEFNHELKNLFLRVEAIINCLVLNFETNSSFNDILDLAYKSNLIHYDELNILKTFNHIRNLFTHNENKDILFQFVNNDELILFKAILLETRDCCTKLLQKYAERIFYTYAVIKPRPQNTYEYSLIEKTLFKEIRMTYPKFEKDNNIKLSLDKLDVSEIIKKIG